MSPLVLRIECVIPENAQRGYWHVRIVEVGYPVGLAPHLGSKTTTLPGTFQLAHAYALAKELCEAYMCAGHDCTVDTIRDEPVKRNG